MNARMKASKANAGPISRTYETKPFPKPRAVAGPLTASVMVESNRPETYLVAPTDLIVAKLIGGVTADGLDALITKYSTPASTR